jgi:hypothetical protein
MRQNGASHLRALLALRAPQIDVSILRARQMTHSANSYENDPALHLEIERQIGELTRMGGTLADCLPLLNRCSLIIKELEERCRGPKSDTYIASRTAFHLAVEACEQLIRDYEAHRDPGGIVTGPDFNFEEIEAVKTAIVRIQCAEASTNATGEKV